MIRPKDDSEVNIQNRPQFLLYWKEKKKKNTMNKLLILCLSFFTSMVVCANDSILVNKEWTERQTIFINEKEVNSIGEDSVIENNGIACGYDRCKKIYFLGNHQFKKIETNGNILMGQWSLKDDVLTIKYDKKYRGKKKKYKFIIKYREKEYPTLYLFTVKVFCCYIFCNYK